MTLNEKRQITASPVQKRIKTFTRIEKVFYMVLLLTALAMSVSTIFLHSRLLQVQQEITKLKRNINDKKTDLTNAKQEVSDMVRLERITGAAKEAGLNLQYNNIKKVK